MRILYLGDIVGERTIDVLKNNLEALKQEYKINLVLVNAENVSGGKGMTEKHYKQLKALGIAGMSMGNHTFSKSEIKNYIDDATIVRPANLNTSYGKDILYIKYNDKIIVIINLLGRVYTYTPLDDPCKTMDNLLEKIEADYIIVDFHGDATSEKKAFFYDFSGKVDAILGSHTHTQTADEQVYNNTCFITDMGMCGAYESILGDEKDMVIQRFRTGMFEPLKCAPGNEFMLNGVILDFGINNTITRINKKYTL
jgi:metallophosphoesterase (TIGR00282 family)